MTSWIAFNVLIVFLLMLDLFVLRRKNKPVSMKEGLAWSFFWIALAIGFAVYLYFVSGKEAFLTFLTGYVVEKSLSIDNLFVFLLIFSAFKTPFASMHKVLFWGILGAMVARAIFILGGVYLVQSFHFLIYVLGIIILLSGIKMAFSKKKAIDPENNMALRLCHRFFRVTKDYEDNRFFVRRDKKIYATPLFLVLLLIEGFDIVFAIDSIPAIMAITLDPFIIYTSNIFAILGLRALFFVLSGLLVSFKYLHYGICLILMFIGVKMLLSGVLKISPLWMLLIVFSVLFLSIALSLLSKNPPPKSNN